MSEPDQIVNSHSRSIQYVAGHLSIPKRQKRLRELGDSHVQSNHPLTTRNFSKPARLPHEQLIGIPTIEGIEFLDIGTILCCEGLQKCTRIITTEKTDIISSYNIGKFIALLEGFGFFACHRSHLINLKFVKKYTREGYIYLKMHAKPVPLARRRKCKFLGLMRHL